MTPRCPIRIAHSPDADDAFMFHALARGKLDTGRYAFEHVLADIQTLNERALQGTYEVTAVSVHAYAYLTDRYLLLPHGASMGVGYGPRLVARRPWTHDELPDATVAVPGQLTTAFLALHLFRPGLAWRVLPFDRILPAVVAGEVDVGLIIHEGQVSYRDAGLVLVADLGEWWARETGLPLPLGGNAIRRDLGQECIADVSRLIKASIEYGLAHRAEALESAERFCRGLPRVQVDEFVGMYVNERTLEWGPDGREAVRELLERGFRAGVLPHQARVQFADDPV